MDRTKDVPEVTQADREAGWLYRPSCYKEDPETKAWWMEGGYDRAGGVPNQAFARHRTEATRPLTAEIADLRQRTESLWDAIKHGDDEHRAWLKEAINAHLAGEAVPETRGKGRKEAEISDLRAQLDEAMWVMKEARFLCDRLGELDWSQDIDDLANDFNGHVDPPLSRLRRVLSEMKP
ncbi:hypothetical protein [Qipengyuania pacifica]|uniref:hypothetical protein n=1 Tax=Qipengyuania pacifica TaxID=2860199 RepID=UPI001C9E151A|nr:hypothetical protein [Qipengyuania pacifica]MBY8333158.1 hypothetical protein [Qipengyuania pacifica]